MRISILTILILSTLFGCKYNLNDDLTIRSKDSLKKTETLVTLPIVGKTLSSNFSYLLANENEYFTYEYKNHIYMVDLKSQKTIDSITLLGDSIQQKKYGYINSFCFNGKDSLFVALNNAILFIYKKQISKIIPINDLDTIQYKSVRFENLEDAPIYFDKNTNEIVGEVHCSTCALSEKSWFTQKRLGHISLISNKLSLYDLVFPDKYLKGYYGFLDHLYIDNYDSLVLVDFMIDDKIYTYNRNTNMLSSFWAKSRYQKKEVDSISLDLKENDEEKMKHLLISPEYEEVRYDPYRKFYYRFLSGEVPLKKENGKYSTFPDKKTILMVINQDKEVVGEYELKKGYNKFLSFVGKAGLYVLNRRDNKMSKDSFSLKIINFK